MTEDYKSKASNSDLMKLESAYKAGPGASGGDFDFFLGEWDAKVHRFTPDGSVLERCDANWVVQSLFGGRMIEDRFVQSSEGEETGAVITLRTFCVDTEQWEMVFLWAQQPIPPMTDFIGRRIGDEMHLTGRHKTPTDQNMHSRIRFFNIENDSFSWEHGISIDGGENWYVHTAIQALRKL